MRQKSNSTPASSETLVRNIRRATRKHHAVRTLINLFAGAVLFLASAALADEPAEDAGPADTNEGAVPHRPLHHWIEIKNSSQHRHSSSAAAAADDSQQMRPRALCIEPIACPG
jgi:hypothetical protein